LSKRIGLIAFPVAVLGLVFAVLLGRELFLSRPLPASPAPRVSQPSPTAAATPAHSPNAGGDLSAYSMIPARSLFSPGRSETSVAASAKPAGRPVLHGVVVDGPRSRAYLEDSLVKGVFGYTVGDTVGQGQITTINADRVTITGPEGTFEVLLNDPAKPKPPPGVTPAPAQPRPPAMPTPALRRPGVVPGQPPGVGNQSMGIGGRPPGASGRPPGASGQSSGASGQSSDDDD
jgi:hypothetical protein